LQRFKLEDLLDIAPRDIAEVSGFGNITSNSIVQGIAARKETIEHMLGMDFNISNSALLAGSRDNGSPIAQKKVVFTGKMQRGSREEMQAQARELGAVVQATVSGATDLLVCGQKVGASKLDKATRLGVEIISEADYYRLIEGQGALR